jgi:hypothetical protein
MQKQLLFILLSISGIVAYAQTPQTDERRKATKEEVRVLAHLADSVLSELKVLYKLEVKENSPRKYQPERIALVRSYLLIFQHLENSCEVVAYDKSDIMQIFGKPDTSITKVAIVTGSSKETPAKEMQWLYGNVQRKYVRINNLRYRFYYVNNKLEAVKRDDR